MSVNTLGTVNDSTDWLSTPLPGLATVEAALRCQICKDFFKTPMLTSCNHTFCSLCIRRALASDGKCPLCRASEQEMKLRSNWSMEEVVAAFTQARPAVLDFARKPPPTSRRSISPPKRTTRELEGSEEPLPSSKRLRSSTRLSKTRSMAATAEMARQEVDMPDPEPETEPLEPDDGLVACPICWKRMKPIQVDRHLDTSCPGEPQPDPPKRQAKSPLRNFSIPTNITNAFPSVSSSSRTSTPTPERLPARNYSMLKDVQLRKELADLGLSTAGGRYFQERRHKEWVMMWNANCDSQRPRRRAELMNDLDLWERTFGSRAPTTSHSSTMGAQIKDKDFDGAAWAAKHDTSFRDLIANARKSRTQSNKPSDEDKGNSPGDGDKENEVNGKIPCTENGNQKINGTTIPPAEKSGVSNISGSNQMVVDLTSDPASPIPINTAESGH
ncbi:DNA repair protein rad18 [Xylariaceae sp. FL1272]|nr:DNA repair protein rad18 [Xylariaceae sp. FL1272]